MSLIKGIHHVTAVALDPQENVDFYAGILGLRLVKKTINFDAPEIYHLYYGNENGDPGTLLTFFVIPGVSPGVKGEGQLTVTSFSIPSSSLSYWISRFIKFNVKFKTPIRRFDDTVVYFEDRDGLGLELVANTKDERTPFTYGNIPLDNAIRGIYGITLSEKDRLKTAEFLEKELDFKSFSQEGDFFRYSIDKKPGTYVDIYNNQEMNPGIQGYGTVHHVAFAALNDEEQLLVRDKLIKNRVGVTSVIDRQYFHSIYFREPGGVLYEVATLPPGFAVDEPIEHLGESLKLPPWVEKHRNKIENHLRPIQLDLRNYAD